MLATTNPLAELKPDQRPQWFKMHTDTQAREACKQWLPTLTMTDLFDPFLPETVYVYVTKLLLGDSREGIRASNRKFNVEVLEGVKLGQGYDDYGQRTYETYEPGRYPRMSAREAIQLFIKFGPKAVGSGKGKVREYTESKKTKKAS